MGQRNTFFLVKEVMRLANGDADLKQ